MNDDGITCARPVALFAALLCGVMACADDHIEVRGVIEWNEVDPVNWEVPDHFDVGVVAAVTVTTYGGGCDLKGPTLVTVDGPLVIIEPYDLINVKSRECPTALRSFLHTADVTVTQAGDVTVRLIGMTAIGDSVITVERTVPAQ